MWRPLDLELCQFYLIKAGKVTNIVAAIAKADNIITATATFSAVASFWAVLTSVFGWLLAILEVLLNCILNRIMEKGKDAI